MHGYWQYDFGGHWMFFGLGPLVLAAIVVAVGYLVLSGRPERPETARDILERRYANGEITKEQFEQMKRDLS